MILDDQRSLLSISTLIGRVGTHVHLLFHFSLVSLGAQHWQHMLHEVMWAKIVRRNEIKRRMPIARGLLAKIDVSPSTQFYEGGPE